MDNVLNLTSFLFWTMLTLCKTFVLTGIKIPVRNPGPYVSLYSLPVWD